MLCVTDKLLAGLNPEQRLAAQTVQGPLLIMAGAGSGKTRVLTHRIAYLIEQGVLPWHILAITFTNKAAKEMQDRVITLLGTAGQDVWVSTFHALGVRILRRYAQRIGYAPNFTITDSAEQLTLVKRLLKAENLDPKKYDPKSILHEISNAKNNLQTPHTYEQAASSLFEQKTAQIYRRYQQQLKADNIFDFDDLIMETLNLLEHDQEVLSHYQRQFEYVHVDEYQDTNEAQYRLVKLLGGQHQNICVVGDADQSIYGWRGANMANILNFTRDYPSAKTVLLEQNYRSTQHILEAANAVIDHNTLRQPKKLWTENDPGAKVKYYRAQSEMDEANFLVQQVQEQVAHQQRKYGDMAVLYRTNAQSRAIEDQLVAQHIPYRLIGGHRFYDRKEIKDIIAYLRLLTNPNDSLSFNRVINEPKRGIGQASVEKLALFAQDNGWSLLEAAANVELSTLSTKVRRALTGFSDTMMQLQRAVHESSTTEITQAVLAQTGYQGALQRAGSLEAEARLDNLNEFLTVTQQYDGVDHSHLGDGLAQLDDFITNISLLSDQDEVTDSQNQVTLMTLHAAKGLEFPVVFLIGMEEGLFPLARSMEEDEQLEEERRLAYVGITRAQQELYLSNAYSRMLYGRRQTNRPSRFIEEIGDDQLEALYEQQPERQFPFDGQAQLRQRRRERAQARPTARLKAAKASGAVGAEKQAWQVGDKVEHRKWGIGTVVQIEGTGDDLAVTVAFPEEGLKKLMASFAPIKKVNES